MKCISALILIVATLCALALSATALNSRLIPTIPGLHEQEQDELTAAKPNAAVTYLLAMERPKPNGDLTLHGLWINGLEPKTIDCPGEKFDPSKLAPIRADLDNNWYSYKEKSSQANEKFWEHEWSKHGTCYAKHQAGATQLQYFTHTLHLLGDVGYFYCDKPQFCDCRCTLDANFKLIGTCAQKGDKPPV